MLLNRILVIWSVALAVCLCHHVAAQQEVPTDTQVTFEVASVRRNVSGTGGMGFNIQPGGRFTAMNMPLAWLIEAAYGLGHHQMEGGPSWIHTERFDVIAKAEADIPRPLPGEPPGAFHFMLRALLAERFNLAIRRHKREAPIYELRFARTDEALGAGLRKLNFDCTTAEKMPDGRRLDQKDGRPTCGMAMRGPNISAHAIPLSQLVTVIEGQVERPVVDRTKLNGLFEVDLEWSTGTVETTKPSLFTALQEQLGLKLVAARGAVDVLIVERAEMPKPD